MKETTRKKLEKEFPIIDKENNMRLDDCRNFGYSEDGKFMKNHSGYNEKLKNIPLEEIEEAITIADLLYLYEFYLPRASFDPYHFKIIMKVISDENIEKIVITKKQRHLVIKTNIGFFAMAPRIVTNDYKERYNDYLELVEEKRKFFDKKCEHCGNQAIMYDSFTGQFWCEEHQPEETIYNEVFFEYLGGISF